MATAYEQMIPVPRVAVEFPLELPLPQGFVADEPATWPKTEGQLEFVGGKLYYMPPSADRQQDTSIDVATVLGNWRKSHAGFVVGGNEAGMILGGESRGADAAVWRRSDLGPHEGKYRRAAPILAIEIQGEVEDETALRNKAAWYLARGVEVVWLLFPSDSTVLVLDSTQERSFGAGDQLPERASLPGLTPRVVDLFEQVRGGA